MTLAMPESAYEARDMTGEQLYEANRNGKTFGDLANLTGLSRSCISGRVARYREACGLPIIAVREANKRKGDESRPRDIPPPKGGGKQLDALGKRDCRFPIGDPGSKDFVFCARRRDGPSPYCPEHRRRCYIAKAAGAQP